MPSTALITQHSHKSALRPQPHLTITASTARGRSSAYSTASSLTLPSPSIVAARAYFLEQEHALPASEGLVTAAASCRRQEESLFEGLSSTAKKQQRLVLDTSSCLLVQLKSFTFVSPKGKRLNAVDEDEDVEKDESMKFDDHEKSKNVTGEDISSSKRRASSTTPRAAEILSQVPFEFTHNHLREWGYAYLGNIVTADVFVNAVCIRRPSMDLESTNTNDSRSISPPMIPKLVTIRARVIPSSKQRKPFLIQREFDIPELRASIPSPNSYSGFPQPLPLRRSKRIPNLQSHSHPPSAKERGRRRSSHDMTSIPIHIAYALHFLPILGSLMLSGYIHKLDTIDLPLPHPEAWRSVVTYIYTGNVQSLNVAGVREIIWYLGGNV